MLFIGRLAGPETFAALAFPLIVLNLLEILTEQGLGNAVIQRRGRIKPFLSTVYVVNIIRGFFLGVLLSFATWFVPDRFVQPGYEQIFLALALVPVIKGFENLANVVLPKKLDFKRLVVLEVVAAALGLVTTIATWFAGFGLWSLIIGKIATAITTTTGSYFIVRRFHGFRFSFARYLELHSFGIWVMASRYASTALTKGGAFVVAALLPAVVLSYYQYADLLATTVVLEIARVTNRVAFPAYSKVKDDQPRLASLFRKSLIVVSLVSFAIAAGLAALADDIVLLLLGTDWKEAGPLIPFIAIWGTSRAIGTCLTSLLMAVGRPGAAAGFQYLMLILLAIGIYPAATQYGALGICVLLAVVGLAVQLFRYPLVAKSTGLNVTTLLRIAGIPFVAMCLSVCVTLLLRNALVIDPLIPRIIVSSIVVTLCYATTYLLLTWLCRNGSREEHDLLLIIKSLRRRPTRIPPSQSERPF